MSIQDSPSVSGPSHVPRLIRIQPTLCRNVSFYWALNRAAMFASYVQVESSFFPFLTTPPSHTHYNCISDVLQFSGATRHKQTNAIYVRESRNIWFHVHRAMFDTIALQHTPTDRHADLRSSIISIWEMECSQWFVHVLTAFGNLLVISTM